MFSGDIFLFITGSCICVKALAAQFRLEELCIKICIHSILLKTLNFNIRYIYFNLIPTYRLRIYCQLTVGDSSFCSFIFHLDFDIEETFQALFKIIIAQYISKIVKRMLDWNIHILDLDSNLNTSGEKSDVYVYLNTFLVISC